MPYDSGGATGKDGGTIVPPRDGEGNPLDDDELLAKVIPLRRRGREPRILRDEPGVSERPENPPAPVQWSIWDPLPPELRRRERKPATLHILADEPGGGLAQPGAPSATGEWSIWDPAPPPRPRRHAPDAGRSAGPPVRGLRRPRRLVRATAATIGTIAVAVALASVLGVLRGQSRPTPQRASSGLPASRSNGGSSGVAAQPSSPPRRGMAAHARPAQGRTTKTRTKAPKLVQSGPGVTVSRAVRYQLATVQSPTAQSPSPPPAENTTSPDASSASANASREFGFEH